VRGREREGGGEREREKERERERLENSVEEMSPRNTNWQLYVEINVNKKLIIFILSET
jgi:hypothetical protein